ncbi:MAG: MTH938/NDUFAF3 family protein [Bacteroidales bacterium]|nr:MTH938/NDUFAF3 family protein [Bacteroidales bacterium]
MFTDKQGPIEAYEFGKFVINGEEHYKEGGRKAGAGKDIRITPVGISEWEERKGHMLTPEMITGVFRNDVETLIIGMGAYGGLECPDSVSDYIKANGISEVILEKTPEACRIYNELHRKGKPVALLAHGTC